MRIAIALLFLGIVALAMLGTPVLGEKPELANHYNSPEPILPMTFAHRDHTDTQCIDCHHNYVDNTGVDSCMSCHVSNAEVWPLFEQQFHALCMDCHQDLARQGKPSGPVRQCQACHLQDRLP